MDPYWAILEELQIPVGYHMAEDMVGNHFNEFMPDNLRRYRITAGDPILLEDVLIRYPRLRIYVMHFGSPLIDHMIAIMHSYPQVYVDIGGSQWYNPEAQFLEQLQTLMNANMGKRIMFGSDVAGFPETIVVAMDIINRVPFLSEEQKRDILYNNAARFLRLSPEEIARHHGEVPPATN
jgi:predicted TIM-barrel fold metal-dependent hydrolase